MVELTGGLRAAELTERLLAKYNIFVKDLSTKTGGEYLRLAVRDRTDNDALIKALSTEL